MAAGESTACCNGVLACIPAGTCCPARRPPRPPCYRRHCLECGECGVPALVCESLLCGAGREEQVVPAGECDPNSDICTHETSQRSDRKITNSKYCILACFAQPRIQAWQCIQRNTHPPLQNTRILLKAHGARSTP